jgi:hypothetical protein
VVLVTGGFGWIIGSKSCFLLPIRTNYCCSLGSGKLQQVVFSVFTGKVGGKDEKIQA